MPTQIQILSAGAVILLAAAGLVFILTRPSVQPDRATATTVQITSEAASQSVDPIVLQEQSSIKTTVDPSPDAVPGQPSVQKATLASSDPVSLNHETGSEEAFGFSLSEISPALAQRMFQGGSLTTKTPVAIEDLVYLTVLHLDFSGNVQTGELVVHRLLGEEVLAIFQDLFEAGFPIESIRLIDDFDADDNRSMAANNSSAFCTRPILGQETELSRHSFGFAIHLNPLQNPYIRGDQILPAGSEEYLDRETPQPGMIVPGQPAYEAFISRGWSWGGNWQSIKDYQHMEKIPGQLE